MSEEFEKIGPNSVKSGRGFTVVWRPPGVVEYTDANGMVRVEVEVLAKPPSILVYPKIGGLRNISDDRADEIITNIMNALRYLGYSVERDDPPKGWDD